MSRIHYFVHGRGRGHSVRTLSAVEALRARGHDVRVFASGVAFDFLRSLGDVERVTLVAPGRGMFRKFGQRVREDLGRLGRARPDVVVSDGDGPSVHAAMVRGIPRLAVGHGLVFVHARVPPITPASARLRERVNVGSSSWTCPARVAVHFAPVTPKTHGTVVARPDLRDALVDETASEEDFVLAYFRDGGGDELLRRLVRRGERVVLFGASAAPAGVEVHAPSTRRFAEHLRRCKAIVGTAGNHLPAEAAMLGKRFLAVHARGDFEQQTNARLWQSSGFGVGASFDEVDEAVIARWLEGPPPKGDAVRAMTPASVAIAREVERLAEDRTAKLQVRFDGRAILSI